MGFGSERALLRTEESGEHDVAEEDERHPAHSEREQSDHERVPDDAAIVGGDGRERPDDEEDGGARTDEDGDGGRSLPRTPRPDEVQQLTEHDFVSPYTPAPVDLNRRVGSTLETPSGRSGTPVPTADSSPDSMRRFLSLLAVRPADT